MTQPTRLLHQRFSTTPFLTLLSSVLGVKLFKQFLLPSISAMLLTTSLLVPLAGEAKTKVTAHHSGPAKQPPAPFNDADELLRVARDAAKNADSRKLEGALARWHALGEKASQHPLNEYMEYWQWRQRLLDTRQNPQLLDTQGLRTWLNQHPNQLSADLLRRDWLLNLARQGAWPTFRQEYPVWILKDERELLCYAELSTQLDDSYAENQRPNLSQQIRSQLYAAASEKEFPEGCQNLLEASLRAQLIQTSDVLDILRLLFANNRENAAYLIAERFNYPPALNRTALQLAYEKPAFTLTQGQGFLPNPSYQELLILAMTRIARDNPEEAAQKFTALAANFNRKQRSFVWGQIGMAASKKLLDAAVTWYDQADSQDLLGEVLEWRVRAALRAQRWDMVKQSIQAMNETQRQDPTWVYWLGRAYLAQGLTQLAEAQFRSISGQFNFYGKLAHEELGQKIILPVSAKAVSQNELRFAEQHPGLQRALKFYELEMRFEGNREWNFALRGLNDRQLLAIAEFAKRQQIYDRAINTAERTQNEHDFGLRFLTPYRQELSNAAARAGVDEPYVYGLIRQESRFITNARSNVGASGLMQLMPATAKYVAKKIGINDFQADTVNHISTNLTLGTSYLRMVLDSLDQSAVMAAAAYNAGPNRPRSWRARAHYGKPIEGAVFAETIPFKETRDYVKKVLSNTVYYAAQFEGQTQSLKTRLGIILPPPGTTTSSAE